jgi:hypothetical protein
MKLLACSIIDDYYFNYDWLDDYEFEEEEVRHKLFIFYIMTINNDNFLSFFLRL